MTTTCTAFGLELMSAAELPLLAGTPFVRTGRRIIMSWPTQDTNALDWPSEALLISDERHLDGKVNFQIHSHPNAGYLIAGPEYGAFVLSGDGTHVSWTVANGSHIAAQRLLIAQVLPFAAVLQGLEVLHGSAVGTKHGAVAILGSSGAGKSSLALGLHALGATFLADDVVALESHGDELLAHPGTAISSVTRSASEQQSSHTLLAETDTERLLSIERNGGALPLAVVFALDRKPGGPEIPLFEPVLDAVTLLSATFNLVIRTPSRLQRQLDMCARIAGLCVERVHVDVSVPANDLAAHVAAHLE